jgi:hypothetical protein
MAVTVIKTNPVFANFISLSREQILKMGHAEATVLKNAGDELYKPNTPFADNEAFIDFSAAVHNSIPFFETAGVALAGMVECRQRFSTIPLVKSKLHNTSDNVKKYVVKGRAYLQICTDYKKAKEDYTELLKVAHYFLLRAHDYLLRSLSEF